MPLCGLWSALQGSSGTKVGVALTPSDPHTRGLHPVRSLRPCSRSHLNRDVTYGLAHLHKAFLGSEMAGTPVSVWLRVHPRSLDGALGPYYAVVGCLSGSWCKIAQMAVAVPGSGSLKLACFLCSRRLLTLAMVARSCRLFSFGKRPTWDFLSFCERFSHERHKVGG